MATPRRRLIGLLVCCDFFFVTLFSQHDKERSVCLRSVNAGALLMKTSAALKQKHSKTGDDSKFQGTLLGKPNEHGEVLVEGGNFDTIQSWSEHRKKNNVMTPPPSPPQHESGSRPSSSGLSSLGDGDMDFEMGGSSETPAGDAAAGAMAVDP